MPVLRTCLVIALVLACGQLAAASWTGAALSDRWSVAGNWVGGVVPRAQDEAVFAAPTVRPAINDLPAVRAVVIASPGVVLAGTELAVGEVEIRSGAATCLLPLRTGSLRVASGASLELRAPLAIAGERLQLKVDGDLLVSAAVTGAGAVEVSGRGQLTLAGISTWRGGLRLRQATLRLAADVPASGPGALGEGDQPLQVGEATLVQATAVVARPIAIASGGVTVRAEGGPRILAAPLTFAPAEGPEGTLVGTYLAGARSPRLIDDWRSALTAPAQREDAAIAFLDSAFGTPDERRRFGISGGDGDWDDFAVQWDGWIRITAAGTRLFTASDDGSRVWVDLDHDGVAQAGEWGSNGWGRSQSLAIAAVSAPLDPGVYRLRVQYEDKAGGNGMALLWDDASRSAGQLGGHDIVPAEAFVRPAQLVLGGDHPLTLAGEVTGGGSLSVQGCAAGLAVSWPGRIDVVRGSLACAAPGAIDRAEVTLAAGARLACAGHDQRILRLAGAGEVALQSATLTCTASLAAIITPALRGPGRLRKDGAAMLQCLAEVEPNIVRDVVDGALALADGEVIAVLALRAPLTSRLELPQRLAGARVLSARIELGPGAPAGIGIGAFAADRHGRWYQRVQAQPLRPGVQEIAFRIAAGEALAAEPAALVWDANAAATCDRSGLFLWSPAPGGVVRVQCRVIPAEEPALALRAGLGDLRLPLTAHTGARWELACRPQPFPANPYDPDDFALDAVVTAADGSERRLPGFYAEPMRIGDRGDRDAVEPAGAGTFHLRWRPMSPGVHRMRLEARWRDGRRVACALPPVTVAGGAWDGYVRVDRSDPRFFSVDRDFFWPIGLNLRSITDPRSRGVLGTAPTPARGVFAYQAYLDRFAAAGGNAVEIWLAGWNLGLEWRRDWEGFHGVGRYHQENAARLDRVLDAAWARGVRVNLVISNHGQGSERTDHEWEHNPYNRINGGRLARAAELFHDPWALAGQERLRRYLVARYADHPAVLGWKLWSEVDLTDADGLSPAWHEQAAARWHALDSYGHPCTTHWSGNIAMVDPEVARLPGIDYLCLDAYHGEDTALADLLWSSTRGFPYRKPVLVTEYGGSSASTTPTRMTAELASAAWVGLVCGHAGAPMLWWWEWVDQGGRWAPYRAIAAFIRGEDLRHPSAACIEPTVSGGLGGMWCRAWARPGRMLGYCCDTRWQRRGVDRGTVDGVRIAFGAIDAGPLTLEWWDADRGEVIGRERLVHPGGALALSAPAFARHLAFKLARE